MENNFSVQQSFQVIKETINEARMRFERNGLVFIFWGLVIAIISFGYYFLRKADVPKAYLINWGYLLAAVVTFVYFYVKAKRNIKRGRNFIARLIGWLWSVLNVNIFLIGYGAYSMDNVTFIILLLLTIGYLMTGIIFRSWVIVVAAILMNIAAYVSLYIKTLDELLLFMGGLGIVCIFIPGVILELKRKRYEIQ